MQGEIVTVNGEKVRIKLLRMCACATAMNSLTSCVCPEQGDIQGETTTNGKTSLDEATRHLCVCYINYN